MRHDPLQRVLYSDDPVLGLALLDLRKDLPYRRVWVQLNARPEGVPRRLVRKSRLRPEVSDLQRRLERNGGGDDLSENRFEPPLREVAPAQSADTIQDLALPGRGIRLQPPASFISPIRRAICARSSKSRTISLSTASIPALRSFISPGASGPPRLSANTLPPTNISNVEAVYHGKHCTQPSQG